jgi:hypothetical protein
MKVSFGCKKIIFFGEKYGNCWPKFVFVNDKKLMKFYENSSFSGNKYGQNLYPKCRLQSPGWLCAVHIPDV